VPPKAVVVDVLATPDPPVPHLKTITHAPTFDRDGLLRQVAGYISATQSYYAPATGFCVPDGSAQILVRTLRPKARSQWV
jgi:putative DNA primase/helicase